MDLSDDDPRRFSEEIVGLALDHDESAPYVLGAELASILLEAEKQPIPRKFSDCFRFEQ